VRTTLPRMALCSSEIGIADIGDMLPTADDEAYYPKIDLQ